MKRLEMKLNPHTHITKSNMRLLTVGADTIGASLRLLCEELDAAGLTEHVIDLHFSCDLDNETFFTVGAYVEESWL